MTLLLLRTWRILLLIAALPALTRAQENPAKRLASIVSVAVEEYEKGVDSQGRVVSEIEYTEATTFLADARTVAQRLRGYNAASTQALLDSLITSVSAKRPPQEVKVVLSRFMGALGTAGALDLPKLPLDTARGHALYTANCASCHGERGMGDGPAAKALPIPATPIGSVDEAPDLTPTLAYNIVTVGISASPMPAFPTLSPQQRWEIVDHVYRLRGQKMELPAAADVTRLTPAAAATTVMALLDSALDFAQQGRISEAGDRAFDAYIAFEPLETPVRALEPGLVSGMEGHFANFKSAVKNGDLSFARGTRDSIAAGLPRVVEIASASGSATSAFLQSLLIIVREGFEAILVVGAIVAFLIKTGNRERLRSVWTGVVLALVASAITAVVLQTFFAALPASREIIEGVTMLLAVLVLFSVSYWLISKVEADKWRRFIHERVSSAIDQGRGRALALVAFLAVYREGAETALFYQALFHQGNVAIPLSLGILAGAAILVVVFVLFYRFGIRIPMRPFFMATSVLLYYMAFVFMGKGIRELQEGDVVGITVLRGFPHLPALGIFPSVETLVAQAVLLLLFVAAVIKTFVPQRAPVR